MKQLSNEVIHNIWLHINGKAEGLMEAGKEADVPVMFANALLEYAEDAIQPWWTDLPKNRGCCEYKGE